MEQCPVDILRSPLDKSVIMSSELSQISDDLGDVVSDKASGYKTSAVVEKAVELRGSVHALENAAKTEWTSLLNQHVWDFIQIRPRSRSGISHFIRETVKESQYKPSCVVASI